MNFIKMTPMYCSLMKVTPSKILVHPLPPSSQIPF